MELKNNSDQRKIKNNSSQSNPIKQIKLPGLTIKGNIFLAPIAGFTDAAFRSICIDKGAYFTFTEMVSSEACIRKNKKTLNMLIRAKNEKIIGVQIFTDSPRSAVESMKEILRFNPSLIDINCGCSISKILKSGAGAQLLKDPKKIKEIITLIRSKTDLPVSVKIRSGWDNSSINYIDVGKAAEDGGASLITLHPRLRTDLFRGKANWDHIKILKESLSIPVIGSGDLFTAFDIKNMLSLTKCDGVMIARGAIGNPFIFEDVKKLLTNGNYKSEYLPEEKLLCAIEHLNRIIQIKGDERGCKEMRKHFVSYTRGLPHSADLRKEIVHAKTKNEYFIIIDKYLNYVKKDKKDRQ